MNWKADPVIVLGKHVWAMRLGAYILAGYALLQSLAIIFGGDSRFSTAGYSAAMGVPGAPPVWGWTLLPFALLSLWGVRASSYRVARWSMFSIGIWSMVFAISFAISAFLDPNANFTAMMVYGKDGVLFILVSTAYKYSRSEGVV